MFFLEQEKLSNQTEFKSMDVSIIIPTYNRLWSLPMAIDSCRNTKCKVEIIVVDDGSIDGTAHWLKTQTDVLTVTQKNWGKCWAVNSGFSLAKGKYVRFLDSDDMLNAHAIDEQFDLAEKTNCDVVVSGHQTVNVENKIVNNQDWITCDDFIAQQLGECDSSHYSAYLFKKEFIDDIPHRPDYAYRDDRLFVLELALKKPRVAIHKGFALLHRQHDKERLQFNKGLITTVQNYQHLNLYKKILARLKETDELDTRRKKAAIKILWPLAHWVAKDNINEANEVFNWIKQLDPHFIIPEKGILGKLYRSIGFKKTEKILLFRRSLKSLFK